MEASTQEISLQGIPASPGIAIGASQVFARRNNYEMIDTSITAEEVDGEIKRFHDALEKTRGQLRELRGRMEKHLDDKESRIFDAQLLIVDDKMVVDEVEEMIRTKLRPAPFAFSSTIDRYISVISAMSDRYIKERSSDVKDVAGRIIANLSTADTGKTQPMVDHLPGQRIVVGGDLSPSDTALLDRDNVCAFAIEAGSRTSHTAILARSMGIPAVVGVQKLLESVRNGDLVVVDGYVGMVIINPSETTLEFYAEKEMKKEEFQAELLKEARLRPETVDGFQVQLVANIEKPEDTKDVKICGAAGVGLFRTEYMFMNRRAFPSEDEQFTAYRKAAADLNGQPVVIRTLDIGGDKLATGISAAAEPNPFLGFRAIRFCLEFDSILRSQIRAILRASAFGDVKILFPMVTCVEEVKRLREILDEEREALRNAGIAFSEKLEVGIMIEVPSAALVAEYLAEHVDFFSLGTNDLVQYTLAVDRGNQRVAYLYQPAHPAILKLIRMVVAAARGGGIWTSVCGEMASDMFYAPILVGMGVHELSMSPIAIGSMRRVIRRMRMHEAEEIAKRACACATAEEALAISQNYLERIAPDTINFNSKGA